MTGRIGGLDVVLNLLDITHSLRSHSGFDLSTLQTVTSTVLPGIRYFFSYNSRLVRKRVNNKISQFVSHAQIKIY